jgi:D-threonine aldolase
MKPTTTDRPWYEIRDVERVASPGLAFFPVRIDENIRRMVRIAGDARRLRPHVKTHKTGEIVRLQLAQGIRRFKCSTIAEAEMAAMAGAPDVLLAMQPVGPAVARFFALRAAYPETSFSVIADAPDVVAELAAMSAAFEADVSVWVDINCGMNRTGISPGTDAVRLYRLIHESEGLRAGGLHVYDGHIHESDIAERTAVCEAAFAPVVALQLELERYGLPVPAMVCGGTPTFPIHARRAGVELSPGTPLLWDAGYSVQYPDLDFLHAAVLVGRVVSKPAPTRVCLDLGTKAVASEMPQPRVTLLGIAPYTLVAHNEEHLVFETDDAARFRPGDVVYGIPTHICPTVARYESATVVREGCTEGEWAVAARDRRISV